MPATGRSPAPVARPRGSGPVAPPRRRRAAARARGRSLRSSPRACRSSRMSPICPCRQPIDWRVAACYGRLGGGARAMSHATATTSELERLVDLSVDMLCVTTLSSRFLVVNPSWTLTLGWSEEELRGRRVSDLVHPGDSERALAEAARLREPGTEIHDLELRLQHRDGSYRWIMWSSRSDGERLYAVARDITHRKLADEALRKNVQWLRKLVQTAAEGIWVLDAGDRTTFVNKSLARMLGYSAEEMLGRPVYDFLTVHGRSLAQARLASRRRG